MFNYRLITDDEFISNYEKEAKKSLIKVSSILIGILDILFLILMILGLLNSNSFDFGYLIIFTVLIVSIQAVIVIRYSVKKSREAAKILRNSEKTDITLVIEENGVSIYSENLLRHIEWRGISDIKAKDKELLIYYKVNGISSNIFYFEFFEASREEIINEFEKYKAVGRV